ncbi:MULTISPECIES: class I SAM-dependent methyltransferase [Catenuloplanes]|uniref:SAM-dependent methyltransferase n=1 Tax=Catenuloplanes niger TaxID=587534 RepID=A0AAE3ZM71_9ACTN|nr:class I SAM-dependent methyltransferase [Catenuloplanes niger]MDR7321294.1 SAM-dependent methyltransferase [Catenuloplanes niger]
MSEHHGHGHGHDHHDDEHLAELLELDGAVLTAYHDEVLSWVAERAPEPVGRIVDLGAGTGVGTLALAARFPTAGVVAVDQSPRMLERIRTAAAHRGLGDRVETLAADLAHGWPPVDRPGIVWAALSLHHVPDPPALLRQAGEHLRRGGLLVISEMPDQPYFTDGEPWEARLHEALATRRLGFDPHPDWTGTLTTLGFTATRRDFPIEVAEPADLVRRYFLTFLRRMRGALADQLTPADLHTVDHLLASNGATGPTPVVRTSRTVWIASTPS